MSFVHLHVHTNFSFGDGACRIDELVARGRRAGMPALAVTDHEGLYGAVRFYQACRKAGIKPIVGVELTVEGRRPDGRPGAAGARRRRRLPAPAGRGAAGARADRAAAAREAPRRAARRRAERGAVGPAVRARPPIRTPPSPPPAASGTSAAATVPLAAARRGAGGYHLVLLARDYAGWSNLCRIISAAHLEHPGEPPVARLATLAEHAATSSRSRPAAAARCGRRLAGRRQGRRPPPRPPSSREHLRPRRLLRRAAARAAARLGAPRCAQLDLARPRAAPAHGGHQQRALPASQDDAPLHDVLAAEAANQPLPNPLGRKNAELYFKSPAQMRRLFRRHPEAYRQRRPHRRAAATSTSASGSSSSPPTRCRPARPPTRCSASAASPAPRERYRPLTPEVTARLERELKVIQELGFAEYFLAVHDIVEFARARAASTTPAAARPATASSATCCASRDADPIAHDLLFERFLNPARREMPDVDIDFCSARRDEVIEYIYERFGHDKVAMVATVNTVHAPSAVRIVAKAFGFRAGRGRPALAARCPGAAPPSSGRCSPSAPSSPTTSSSTRTTAASCTSPSASPTSPPTWARTWAASSSRATRSPTACRCSGPPRASSWPSSTRTTSRRWAWSRWTSSACACTRPSPRRCAASRSAPASRSRAWELPRDDPKVYELIRAARTVGLFQLESSGQRNLATRLQRARLRRRDRRHLAVPAGAAAGRHDRAVHPAAARARAGHRAAPRHGPACKPHLRRDHLPGAGHRGGRRRGRLQPGRGRHAAARDDARPLAGRDGRDRAHVRREGGRQRRASRRPPRRSSASCAASPPTASTRRTPPASPSSATPRPGSRRTTRPSSTAASSTTSRWASTRRAWCSTTRAAGGSPCCRSTSTGARMASTWRTTGGRCAWGWRTSRR